MKRLLIVLTLLAASASTFAVATPVDHMNDIFLTAEVILIPRCAPMMIKV
ncbi:hypothetical protein J2X84_002270 [Pseudomonas corrugata]|nr:hypothetical protein [Pseudomonas corrugata]MDR7283446.1 hypothetical protein [Pseudomonas corrugata]